MEDDTSVLQVVDGQAPEIQKRVLCAVLDAVISEPLGPAEVAAVLDAAKILIGSRAQ